MEFYRCRTCGLIQPRTKHKCPYCRSTALRIATEEDMKKQSKRPYLIQKSKEMIDKRLIILQELIKNDEEFKQLEQQKNSGEYVDDLITRNRTRYEVLEKDLDEDRKINIKWLQSQEGKNSRDLFLEAVHLKKAKILRELKRRKAALEVLIPKNEKELKGYFINEVNLLENYILLKPQEE